MFAHHSHPIITTFHLQKDHSMLNLVKILNALVEAYESTAKSNTIGADNTEFTSLESPEPVHAEEGYYGGNNDYSTADDRWFILCSQPHGCINIIPTFLSFAAFCCSALGNNTCSLFFREVVSGSVVLSWMPEENGTIKDVAGVTLGLYSYGIELYHPENDEYVLQCSPNVPENAVDNTHIKIARGFSTLALIIGFPVMCFLILANCMMLSRKVFRRVAIALFIITFCQSMIFIYLPSPICSDDILSGFPAVIFSTCKLDSGSRLAIVASALWFLTAIFAAYIDKADLIEKRLRMITMQVVDNV